MVYGDQPVAPAVIAMSTPKIRTVSFPDGTTAPAFGLGTWMMGEQKRSASDEAAALAYGLDLGLTLIDTAEMYGDGRAEEIVARAVAGRREQVFIVSKVYPHNAGRRAAIAACERSLKRLGIDKLDLYLLHWRGRVPLAETVAAFEKLRADGLIGRWGVSNFDVEDLRELWTVKGGRHCATNQVLYHLGERGVEWGLLPWMREHRMPLMAYSPLGQGDLLRRPALVSIAADVRATPAQVALAWLLRQPDLMVIPKAAEPRHVRELRAATELTLSANTVEALEAAFPPPSGPSPLAIL
jgi:diketogulonate reductase-like aldo/keto reductase